MFSCISFVFCILPAVIQAACSGLAFRGGGSFGAVEAGMLNALLDKNMVHEERLEVVSGISAGGLNAGFLASAAEQISFSDAAEQLGDLYKILNNGDIYHLNLLKVFTTWSMYQTAPLNQTIHGTLSKFQAQHPSPFRTLIGSSNLQTGLLDVFDYNDLADISEKVQVLMATSAIPFVFPPVRIEGDLYVDGGLISNEILFQMLPFLTCKSPIVWYFSPSNTLTSVGPLKEFTGYMHRIASLVSNGFDNQLQKMLQKPGSSCPARARVIRLNVCHPNEAGAEALEPYSILQFGNGAALYHIGYDTVQCDPWILCE
jgi:hypothetical protein